MNPLTQPNGMNRRIFDMGLPVEAVSLYLLCCNIARGEAPIVMETIKSLWNSTDEALDAGLTILIKHQILEQSTDEKSPTAYKLWDEPHWKF